jgi:hypothetical protein
VPSAVKPDYILGPHSGGASPNGTPGPTGLSPAAIRHAYGFDQLSNTGAGQTIAIVDAYDDQTISTDLVAFDNQFSLPNPNTPGTFTFTKVNQTGGSTMPAGDTGWAGEISLDVEWAHAIAPGTNILLVEANSASYGDLLSAVSFAAGQPGVVAVSMSWGGGESPFENLLYDSHFTTPTGHAGVVFLASSGDSGAPDSYPAASPNVVSVGGTSLYLDGSNNYSSETAWSGSGGGVSAYESQPAYQNGVVSQFSSTKRTNPDVAYDADPYTGFSVYQTYGNSGGPWLQYGGTSDAAPQWAGLVALADQGRSTPLSSSTLLPMLYQLPASDFHDVTSGASTGTPNEPAGPGYDLATGRGTPVANQLIADLGGTISTTTATHFSVSAPSTVTAGTPFSVTVTALDANNNTVTGFTGTVHFSTSAGSAQLPPDYPFSPTDAGSHTFSVTLSTTGSDSLTVTSGSLTGTTTVTVNPASPTVTHFAVSAPSAATAGTPFSVQVTALDANNNTVTGFTGTVHFTSSDGQAGTGLPADYPFTTMDAGSHSFSVTLKTAGSETVSVASGSSTGTATVSVSPSTLYKLTFSQPPTSTTVGTTISPAVTVSEQDMYNNVLTGDSTTQIGLALGTNPSGATLTGGGAVTVSHGVATFAGLSLNAAGTGYTLVASGGGLSVTSAGFNITSTPTSTVLEGFESGLGNYYYSGSYNPRASTSTSAAHDGTYGLLDPGDQDWYLRVDSAGQINPGDTASVWVRFAGTANGRAYFGFGTTMNGTLSAVLAPNTGQLIIQNNPGFGTYTDLASVSQTYKANHWYRLEVAWGTSGTAVVRLYDSNGQTLLNSVTAATGDVTPGDFAFRATGSTKDFDTVTVTRGVNHFSAPVAHAAPAAAPPSPAETFARFVAAATQEWWTLLTGSASASPPTGASSTPELPPQLFLSPPSSGIWGLEGLFESLTPTRKG